MPELNGFALLEQLHYRNFNLVFTTAYQGYAIEAIRHQAFDYLLKPIDSNELKNCLDKIIAEKEKPALQARNNFSNTLSLSVKNGMIFVKRADIIRLEASGSYTVFHIENKITHMTSKILKEYEAQLDPSVFYRCHHSHLINLSKVTKFVSQDGLFAHMIDGSVVDVARKNKDQFLERLKNMGG